MKIMKILSILTILFGFSQCGSNKFVKNPSFNVDKAVYNKWVGGQPGVSGTMLEIQLKNASDIVFDSLYFQNKVTKVEIKEFNNTIQLIGHFSTSNSKIIQKRDLILDADTVRELENTLPNTDKFPFELEENEAILSFKKGDKTVYYKIKKIKKEISRPIPSVNKF